MQADRRAMDLGDDAALPHAAGRNGRETGIAERPRLSTMRDDPEDCEAMTSTEGIAQLAGPGAQAWVGFQRAHRELTRDLEGGLTRRSGLSLSALELIRHLASAKQRRRRIARLAADIELSVSRVSRIIDALERRDLVRRQPCPEDSRATNVWLTDEGLTLLREAEAAHIADIERVFLDRLDGDELQILATVFERLTQRQA